MAKKKVTKGTVTGYLIETDWKDDMCSRCVFENMDCLDIDCYPGMYYREKPVRNNSRNLFNATELTQMIQMYNEGATNKEIAEYLNRSTSTIDSKIYDLRRDKQIPRDRPDPKAGKEDFEPAGEESSAEAAAVKSSQSFDEKPETAFAQLVVFCENRGMVIKSINPQESGKRRVTIEV